jgi:hypothetical protein
VAGSAWADDLREYSASNEIKLESGKTIWLTQYANNDASRLCFTYAVPLTWSLKKGEPGTLVEENGVARARVLLWSPQELVEFAGEDLTHRAAARLLKIHDQTYAARYELAPGGEPAPYSHGRFRALEIKRSALLEPPVRRDDRFVVAEIGSGWVLAISVEYIQHPRVRCSFCGEFFNAVTRSILETLSTSSDPACYRALQPIPPEMVLKVRAVIQGK